MKKTLKLLFSIITFILCISFVNITYAASASIKASSQSVTVGDSVTITVTINAAAWNINTSGNITVEGIIGANMDAVNQTTTKTYKLDTSKAGTYTASISGDITDADDTFSLVSQSVSVTVKEKSATPNNGSGSNSGTGSSSSSSKPTTAVTKSSDATLKTLKVDHEGLTPSFNKNTFMYTLSVGSDVNSIKVTASPNHSKATYSVSGNTNFENGDNTVTITVKAENGTTKTYKIIVTKAENPEKANAYLTNIIVDGVAISEEFARDKFEYTLSEVDWNVEKLNISVFPENQKATFEIEGAEDLKVGENQIKITVTAEDKKTIKEYFLNVVKKEEPAVEVIGPVVEDNNYTEVKTNGMIDTVKSNIEYQLLILIYILAVVEFIEILYLFFQLREKKEDSFKIKSSRIKRGKGKYKSEKEEESSSDYENIE
ncbi:MAG: cadherin-like beta sandwich domain-containing protein [Clostridia bacterium]|nr:cadherin-like beta sandwich domain-containing protein [Clostridia bacterium]